MKQLWLALLMISTMNGMHLLKKKVECAQNIYFYDLSCESFFSEYGNNINERIHGRTMLDLMYACDSMDFNLIEFMRQRGALTSTELPTELNHGVMRAYRLINHIVPEKAS